MYGLDRQSLALCVYIIPYYLIGFPLAIMYGYNAILSTDDARFTHVNGLYIGASMGICCSLLILVIIRIRIDWKNELKRTQKILDETEVSIEEFRTKTIMKYGRHSKYGQQAMLIEESDFNSPSINTSTSDNIIHENDSEIHRSSSNLYNYYNVYHKNSDNIDEPVVIDEEQFNHTLNNGDNMINIDDFRIGPMGGSIPPTSTPLSSKSKHGPIVI